MIKIDVRDKKTKTIVKTLATQIIPDELEVGIDHEQFVDLLKEEIPISGFVGWVEVDIAFLEEEVPEEFPNSTKRVQARGKDGKFLADDPSTPGIDEAWTTGQKTWGEYCVYKTSDTKALMQIGYRDANGNRSEEVGNDELLLWVAEFGTSNILTKSEGKAKIAAEYTPEIEA